MALNSARPRSWLKFLSSRIGELPWKPPERPAMRPRMSEACKRHRKQVCIGIIAASGMLPILSYGACA